ncbi:tctex1 domain-containing protein 2-like [Octopus sinensis]|uniref:Tctex1 domain-containing protein 2-like n=1 Tax=Octopus sinensis TaxID=2607531 RepID=A0A6P7TF40_9MOLL|nr:tctex1 domain-containing protein 2-like [Octopus sinensis]
MSDNSLFKRLNVRAVGRLAMRKKKNGNLDVSDTKPLKPPRLENTFQLAPSQRFIPRCVEGIIKDIMLAEDLANAIYNAEAAPSLVIKMSDEIKEKLKLLSWKRYRYVVQVLVGQNLSQHFMMASRCLWNEEVDNFVVVKYNNSNLFVICSVFATYLE